MSIDHKICEKCRVSTYPSIFGPDEDVNEVPDDKFIGDDALGWWCSVIRGHVYRTDSPQKVASIFLSRLCQRKRLS